VFIYNDLDLHTLPEYWQGLLTQAQENWWRLMPEVQRVQQTWLAAALRQHLRNQILE
jgi:hypothetical protein